MAHVISRACQPVKVDEPKTRGAAAAQARAGRSPTGASRSRRSRRSPASWRTCWPAACRCRAALHLLRREAANPAAKNLWSAIHDDVVGGNVAGRRAGEVARRSSRSVYVAMVRAGEAGGFLDVVLAADRRLPHPRAGPQGQGQGRDGLPLVLGHSRGRAC